jgi:hypothetical protein
MRVRRPRFQATHSQTVETIRARLRLLRCKTLCGCNAIGSMCGAQLHCGLHLRAATRTAVVQRVASLNRHTRHFFPSVQPRQEHPVHRSSGASASFGLQRGPQAQLIILLDSPARVQTSAGTSQTLHRCTNKKLFRRSPYGTRRVKDIKKWMLRTLDGVDSMVVEYQLRLLPD